MIKHKKKSEKGTSCKLAPVGYSYLRSYSITADGIGEITGDSFGVGPSATFPFIINGGFGVGYTFNLSEMKRHFQRPKGVARKR